MAEEKQKKTNLYREGVPMSEEALKEYEKTWSDMEDCFKEIKGKEEKISQKKDKKNGK